MTENMHVGGSSFVVASMADHAARKEKTINCRGTKTFNAYDEIVQNGIQYIVSVKHSNHIAQIIIQESLAINSQTQPNNDAMILDENNAVELIIGDKKCRLANEDANSSVSASSTIQNPTPNPKHNLALPKTLTLH